MRAARRILTVMLAGQQDLLEQLHSAESCGGAVNWGIRRHAPAGVRGQPNVKRHAMTVPLVPASVRAVRVSTAEALTSFGLAPIPR